MDLDKMFFTADTHFGHANIIRFCSRPFASVEDMDEAMVDRWNRVVPPDGTVYHLGDFAFKDVARYVPRLHGTIHLILGNHDKLTGREKALFGSVRDVHRFKIPKDMPGLNTPSIVLNHYAQLTWNKAHHGVAHAFGHSHGNLNTFIAKHLPDAKMVDVGVDCWDYQPIPAPKLLAYFDGKPGQAVDHHEGGDLQAAPL